MKTNFLTVLIAAVAITCCMSFASNHSVAKLKQTSSPIVVDGYYVDGNSNVTVHIECTTVGGGHIASVRIVDVNNNALDNDGMNGGSASVSGNTITLTNFTQYFKWTDNSEGFTSYSGDLIPE
jgi:hypothetical protein